MDPQDQVCLDVGLGRGFAGRAAEGRSADLFFFVYSQVDRLLDATGKL